MINPWQILAYCWIAWGRVEGNDAIPVVLFVPADVATSAGVSHEQPENALD